MSDKTADELREELVTREFAALAMMPWTSTVFGCASCRVFWVDNNSCWVCDEEGLLLAEPAQKMNLFRQQHNRVT